VFQVLPKKVRRDFMKRFSSRLWIGLFASAVLAESGFAQKPLTWQEVRDRFEAANPTLRAGQIGLDESKAQEITAFLRPNPNLTLSTDGTQIAPYKGVWQPVTGSQFSTNFSYLHERQRKRELRQESAQKNTSIATSAQADLERTLVFGLRLAFVQTLQEKAILELAKENLAYYDHVLEVNRERFKAGAIAQVDLDRLDPVFLDFSRQRQAMPGKYDVDFCITNWVEAGSGLTFLEFFQRNRSDEPKGIVMLTLGEIA